MTAELGICPTHGAVRPEKAHEHRTKMSRFGWFWLTGGLSTVGSAIGNAVSVGNCPICKLPCNPHPGGYVAGQLGVPVATPQVHSAPLASPIFTPSPTPGTRALRPDPSLLSAERAAEIERQLKEAGLWGEVDAFLRERLRDKSAEIEAPEMHAMMAAANAQGHIFSPLLEVMRRSQRREQELLNKLKLEVEMKLLRISGREIDAFAEHSWKPYMEQRKNSEKAEWTARVRARNPKGPRAVLSTIVELEQEVLEDECTSFQGTLDNIQEIEKELRRARGFEKEAWQDLLNQAREREQWNPVRARRIAEWAQDLLKAEGMDLPVEGVVKQVFLEFGRQKPAFGPFLAARGIR